MTKKKKTLYILLFSLLFHAFAAQAQEEMFTPREQQSISTETPRLFDRSTGFTVDFAQYSEKEYSFPLPVGKILGTRKNNNVIIGTTHGDAVKAMFGGVVRLSKDLPQWGNTVVIRHDNGLETVYGNNAQNLVSVGDHVTAGQTVAIVGTKSEKTFCEFAVMVNGSRMNLETLIDMRSHRLRRHTLLFEQQVAGVKITVVNEEKEKTIARSKGRREPQRGNMSDGQNRKVEETASANDKYGKNTEHIARPQDDYEVLDIDEFQSMQFEHDLLSPFKNSNEFTINFAEYTDDQWCYPMKGGKVISPFGGKRRHAGTDIKTKAGDPVYAAFEGKVTLSGNHYGYGQCIVIRHANGLETLYSHQKKNLVKVGDWVKAGEQIGIVGRTGRASTEHCHFEMKCNGRPFDSSKIFDHATNTLKKQTVVFRKTKSGVSIAVEKKH